MQPKLKRSHLWIALFAVVGLFFSLALGNIIGTYYMEQYASRIVPAYTQLAAVSASTLDSCSTSSGSWLSIPFTQQTGAFTIEYDATPSKSDIVGYITLSSNPATAYSSNAVEVRFNSQGVGFVDALNSSSFTSSNSFKYKGNSTYHFKIQVNIPAHTYTVIVNPKGSTKTTTIASNYLFQTGTTTATQLSYLNLITPSNTETVCNGAITSSAPAITTDIAPTVTTPSTQTLTLPTNSITLTASASDPDGTISSYAWTQASGPSTATLQNQTTSTLTASNLIQGAYTFTLTATDNGNMTGSGQVSVTVNAATTVATVTGYSLALPAQDASGWTIIPSSSDTRFVYVSSSQGLNTNDGLSSSTPKQTIAAGIALLRSGYPDHLLLKSGDTFTDTFGFWTKSGRSRTEPMVIASYGTGARPLLKTGTANGFDRESPGSVDHIWIFDMDFYNNVKDPSSPDFNSAQVASVTEGIFWYGLGSDLHLENNRFRFYYKDLIIERNAATDQITDVRIRRNQILDSYTDSANKNSQGLYATPVNNWLIEENIFDHNGWNENPLISATAYASVFNHNLYLGYANSSNLTIQNNVFSRAASTDTKIAAGYPEDFINVIYQNNLMIQSADAISLGGGSGSSPYAQGSFIDGALVNNNVFTEMGRNVNGVTQSIGITVSTGKNVTMSNNYFINKPMVTGNNIILDLQAYPQTNVSFTGNVVYQWAGDYIYNEDPSLNTNVVLTPNNIDLPATSFVDPTRTVGTYDSTVGGNGTSLDFITKSRNMNRGSWNTAYTASPAVGYIGAGFVLK